MLRHLQGQAAGANDLYQRSLNISGDRAGPATDVAALLDDLATGLRARAAMGARQADL